jgi:hypothetical protein
MDENELGREQARLLRQAIVRSGLRLDDVWMHYFSIGGDVGALEVEAYLHHALSLPRLQRDMLAHAINELIDNTPSLRAPYASELPQGDSRPQNQHEDDDDSPT